MRDQFCLNAATIKTTPLERQIQIASTSGFGKIGLWLEDVDAAVRGGKSLGDISALLRHAGLKVNEFCFVGGWQETDEEGIPKIMQDPQRIFQVSQAPGCDLVVAVPALTAGFLKDGPLRFRRLCEIAAGFHVRIALEFVGTAAEVKDVRTAWHIVSTGHRLSHYQSRVVIESAGSDTSTERSFDSSAIRVSFRLLFVSSATMLPCGVRNAAQRTSSTLPVVSMRTSPGRTNLLKCSR